MAGDVLLIIRVTGKVPMGQIVTMVEEGSIKKVKKLTFLPLIDHEVCVGFNNKREPITCKVERVLHQATMFPHVKVWLSSVSVEDAEQLQQDGWKE